MAAAEEEQIYRNAKTKALLLPWWTPASPKRQNMSRSGPGPGRAEAGLAELRPVHPVLAKPVLGRPGLGPTAPTLSLRAGPGPGPA